MKRLLLVAIALSLLVSCSDSRMTAPRPRPPNFIDSGNKPSQEVALNFVKKFSSQVQAAIDRTPYEVKDIDKQMKIAQQLYREDGNHLIQWVDEEEKLFKAANIQVCDLYLRAAFAT